MGSKVVRWARERCAKKSESAKFKKSALVGRGWHGYDSWMMGVTTFRLQ